MDDREMKDAMKRERQKVVESLRRKVFGLRGLADLMVHIRDIDEGVDIGELGNTVGELTEGMLDMIDTLEDGRDDE